MAILSAVELVNLLYDARSVTHEEMTRIFNEYYETRRNLSRLAVEQSNQNGALIHKRVTHIIITHGPFYCQTKRSTGAQPPDTLVYFILPSSRVSLVISLDTYS